MTTESPELPRLHRLLALVAKEDAHLRAVRGRLFDDGNPATLAWVEAVLASPEGIDRLESFGAKFSRTQDTIMDKLLPQLLGAAGELPGTAIDNLTRAERLNLVGNTDEWIAMRRLRNRLVHEYIESAEEMVPVLEHARRFTDELHRAYMAMAAYARDHLGLLAIPESL